VAHQNTNGGNALPDPIACINIWNALLQNPPTILRSQSRADYYARTNPSGQCLFQCQPMSGMGIAYSAASGAVTIDSQI